MTSEKLIFYCISIVFHIIFYGALVYCLINITKILNKPEMEFYKRRDEYWAKKDRKYRIRERLKRVRNETRK